MNSEIEGWMVPLLISIIGAASGFAVVRSKVNESGHRDKEHDARLKSLEQFMDANTPFLKHLSKVEESFSRKIDEHSNSIVEINQKVTQSPTMKEVRDEFVTKEMYKQMEKHIDEKFYRLEVGLNRILKKLDEEH